MEKLDWKILKEIAELEKTPIGAYNFRVNGQLDDRQTTANIDIQTKTDKPGIDITVKPGTKGESVHIPVVLTETGLKDLVYNDFYIGEGEGTGERILNPRTEVYLDEGASITLEMTQIAGVDSTIRDTVVVVGTGGECILNEKLLTDGHQRAESNMEIILDGEGATGRVVSRSVGKGDSVQVFRPCMTGKAASFGHVQCDSIIMDNAKIKSIPAIDAQSLDAQLIHEAAIGKIAGEQLTKLMTLGLTEKEAEEQIVNGFLK